MKTAWNSGRKDINVTINVVHVQSLLISVHTVCKMLNMIIFGYKTHDYNTEKGLTILEGLQDVDFLKSAIDCRQNKTSSKSVIECHQHKTSLKSISEWHKNKTSLKI